MIIGLEKWENKYFSVFFLVKVSIVNYYLKHINQITPKINENKIHNNYCGSLIQ